MQHIDLNLLPVLRVLLDEESVTRAAARLHLSVPATSRALDRARRTFGDPLLVRRGRGVVMTPMAMTLRPQLDALVESIGALVERPRPFEPAELRQTFVIRGNEAVVAALGTLLLDLVRSVAPHVELRFEHETADDIDALGAGDVALAIGSYGDRTSDVDAEPLATERLVGVLRVGHRAPRRPMTLPAFAALDHIAVARRAGRDNPIDRHLAEHGLSRTVAAVVPSFATALAMVAGSDVTAVAPSRLAATFAGPAGVRTFQLPVPGAEVTIDQLWHQRYRLDPAHRWLRGCVATAAASLSP